MDTSRTTPGVDPVAWLLERGLVTVAQVAECRLVSDGSPTAVMRLLIERGHVDPVEMAAIGIEAGGTTTSSAGDTVRRPDPETPTAQAAPSSPSSSLPDRIARFEIREVLGRGGMGVVYRAWDPDLRREVALKVLEELAGLDETSAARFQREARTAARLRHPGIVQVHEVGSTDGVSYIAMDYIAGTTLREEIRTGGVRDLRESASIARRVAEALGEAHREGIVHRDVKPENVLLDREGTPHLGDFGLAKEMDAATRLTVTGMVMGTPAYMAPEQAEGREDLFGPATDVYGLGAVLYELLTGRPPHQGTGKVDILYQIVHSEALRPSALNARVPRDLEVICLKCLDKDPSRRYADGRDVAADLDRFLAGEAIVARPASALYRLRRWASRRRSLVGGIVVAAAVSLTAVVLLLRASRDSERTLDDSDFWRSVQVEIAEAIARQRGGDVTLIRRVLRESLHLADRRLRDDPDAAGAHFVRGKVLRMAGRAKEAESALSEALSRRPDDPSALYERGLARIERYRLGVEEARRRWRGAAAGTPDRGGSRRDRTLVEIESSRPDLVEVRRSAEADFSRLAELLREGRARTLIEGAAECGRGLLELNRGDLTAAGVLLKEALLANRFRDEAWDGSIARARLLWERGEGSAEDLLVAYDGAIEANRGRWELWTGRAEVGGRLATELLVSGGPSSEVESLLTAAFSDVDKAASLEEARPEPRVAQAALLREVAEARERRGEDVRELLQDSIARAGEALQLDSSCVEALETRGASLCVLAGWLQERGGDPRPDLERAIADFSSAVPSSSDPGSTLVLLGSACVWLGDDLAARGVDPRESYRAGIATFQEALGRGHAPAEVRNNMGWAAIRLAEFGQDSAAAWLEAIGHLEAAIALDPSLAIAWSNRGLAWLGTARSAEAAGQDPCDLLRKATADFTEALSRNSEYQNAYTNRAAAWLSLGDAERVHGGDAGVAYRNAAADLAEVIRRNPRSAEAQTNRGLALFGLGQVEESAGRDPRPSYREAVAALGEALAANPELVEAYVNRGVVWRALGVADDRAGGDPRESFRSAIRDYDAALARNSGIPALYNNRARSLQALGAAESTRGGDASTWMSRALADYAAAISMDPTWIQPYVNQGELLEWLERFDEAVSVYQAAREATGEAYPEVDQLLERARSRAGADRRK